MSRQDLTAGEHLLRQLQSGVSSEPELDFQISLLEIDYLQREGSFSVAYAKIEDKIDELKAEGSDVYQGVHMFVLKALLLCKIGNPGAAFAIAVRASIVAYHAMILPALWEAVGTLASILSELEEFEMAHRLLDAIIPQVYTLSSLMLNS
jgi:anaphase-promoting complex subunit 5